MRLLSLVPLAFMACSSESEVPMGTYAVSWILAGSEVPTCESHRISDVIVSAIDTTSNNTVSVTTPCTSDLVMLDVPVGSHRIELEAIGEFDDVAGMAQTTGVIDDEGMVITLPETALAVAPPTSTASSWIDLERDGQPTTCYATRSTGVAIMLSPTTGESTTDIFDCGRGPFVIGVPYGPFSVEAVLLGNHDITIGTSPRLMVPATRGTSSVEVVIAAD